MAEIRELKAKAARLKWTQEEEARVRTRVREARVAELARHVAQQEAAR
jgi:hypothetical protein